ncbi:MAG: alpha/beta fold hydrolase [Bacteroidia bacterium]
MKPETKYTKSGRINIAYQVFGSGPIDIVYIPGWVSNIDWMWACPELVTFLQELGKIARVILFDKRGTGLSDRIIELSTVEERMDDIRAVMDAVHSEKAVLFGHSEGGSVSALFAATYPNRTIALISFGIFAKRRYAPDYPWAPTDEERQLVYDMIENSWGSGKMNLASLAPSKADDKPFMDWLANYFRSGASPSAAMVLTKMNTQVDIVDILGSIKVPTLIMQRTHDIDVKIDEGRFIADHIEGAKFVELDGDDHLFWVGDAEQVLEEMRTFISDIKPKTNYVERLFTFVAARILPAGHDHTNSRELVGQFVAQYRGTIVRYHHEGFIATFDGPSKAVHCSMELVDALQNIDTELTIGIHIKEATVEEVFSSGNQTEAFLEPILNQASPKQVLITQSVKNLLSGAGLSFAPIPYRAATLPGEISALYAVSDPSSSHVQPDRLTRRQSLQNDSFLENVLQCIDTHIGDDAFGVEMLCKEVGISERQLQRKLKAITNKSPIQLISSVRLHRAKELILNDIDNITEVSYQMGFSSPSYFAKCFKKEFGFSPSTLWEGGK